MKYDLIVSDFDGTLGIAPDHIEQDTVAAVNTFIERGGKFAICTGRMYQSIRNICIKYGFKGPVISYQGAMINDIETGNSLFTGGIEHGIAAEVTEKLLKEGIQVIVDIDDVLYYEKSSPYTEYYEKAVHVKGEKVKDLAELISDKKKVVQKVGGICEADSADVLTAKYREMYGGRLIFNNGSPKLIEVINPECCKSFAVRFLSEYYKVGFDKIMAIGDSTNDIELLCGGGWHGVAVGDAREELKAVADEITVPFKQNPVKTLIEKYCL